MKALLIIPCLLIFNTFAQRQAAKASFTPMVFVRDFGADYEIKLINKITLNTRTNAMVPIGNPLSRFKNLNDGIQTGLPGYNWAANATKIKLTSFGVSPQFRFYLGDSAVALKGRYFTIYSINQFTGFTEFDYLFKDANGDNTVPGTIKVGSSYIGGGIAWGRQWIRPSGFTFDIIWFGLDFGKLGFKMRGESDGLNPEIAQKSFEEYLKDASSFMQNNLSPEFGSDYVELRLGTPFATIKLLNFSLGWSF